MNDYSIENLVKTFEDHTKEFIKCNEELKLKFQSDYPNEPLPQHFKETFMISEALKEICMQIIYLKNKIDIS